MPLAAGETIRSLDAKVYRNTGTYATPVWVEVPVVKDVTLGMSKKETEVTVRGSGFDAIRGTTKGLSFTFQLQDKVSDAAIAAFNSAYFNDTLTDLWFLSGASDDVLAEGPRAECEVLNFSRNEQLAETLVYDVTVKPASIVNDPTWDNGS